MLRLFRLFVTGIITLLMVLGEHDGLPQFAQRSALAQDTPITLIQTGKTQYDSGQYANAIQTLQQAEQAFQANGNPLAQARSLSLLSLAQQKLGQWPQAETSLQSSLQQLNTLRQNIKNARPQDLDRTQAQTLNAQGKLQWATGKANDALTTWQQAERLYRQANDTTGTLGSQINQAQAMESLGLYRRAEKILEQLEQDLRDRPDDALKVSGLLNLGNILRLEGEIERSHQLLSESLTLAQQNSSTRNDTQLHSRILLSLGNTERVQAKRAEAIRERQQMETATQAAIDHYRDAAAIAPSPTTQAQARLNQLSLLIDRDPSQAKQLIQPLAKQLKQLPLSRDAIYSQVNLAQSLMQLQRWQEAQGLLAIATEQATQLKDPRTESYTLGTLGKLYEQQNRWNKAEKTTRAALTKAQEIRAADIAYQWQWQMGRVLQGGSDNLSQRSVPKFSPRLSHKGRSTVNQKANTKARSSKQVTNPEALAYYKAAYETLNALRSDLVALNPDVQFSFRETVEPVYREYVDLLLRGQLGNAPAPESQVGQALEVTENLQLAEIDNFFRDACAQAESINIIEEFDQIAPSTAILYPILLPDRLEIIVKLPGDKQLRHWSNADVSEQTVDAAVRKLQRDLRNPIVPTSRIKKESQQLYDWLIRPFEQELESAIAHDDSKIKTLAFVPDGSLRGLPMAALHDGQRYLVERYAIAITPGLQLLDPKPLQRDNLRVLLAGASDAPSFATEGLGAIGNVEFELTQIQETASSSELLKDESFVKQNIYRRIESAPFDVVHLATHGSFSSNPDKTFILDWEGRVQVRDFDQMLKFQDPARTDAIELLILSACETAKGDKRAALGLAGMAIRAGARSTMASLWTVDDAATAEFMVRFYEQLAGAAGTSNPGKPIAKAEAIRNVQLAFLKDYPEAAFNRPYYWAPFILVGNWL